MLESGGTTASIVGYLVDFKNPVKPGSILELYVGKSGGLFRQVGVMERPRSAFGHAAGPRSGPESDHEAAARRAAVSAGAKAVAAAKPEFADYAGEVFGYLVRVRYVDGSHADLLVENDGGIDVEAPVLHLQPWPRPPE